MADPTIAVLGIILTQVNTLTKQGAFIMATVQELQAQVLGRNHFPFQSPFI